VDVAITSAEALVRNSSGDPVAQTMATDPSRKRALPVRLAVLAVAMFGFGYLLVPLYSVICRLTGFNQLQSADSVAAGTRTDVNRPRPGDTGGAGSVAPAAEAAGAVVSRRPGRARAS